MRRFHPGRPRHRARVARLAVWGLVAPAIVFASRAASAQAPSAPPSPATEPVPVAPNAAPAPNRFEVSGDTWMAAGAYDQAVVAYERANESAPTPEIARKLEDARARAAGVLRLPRPTPVALAPPRSHAEDADTVPERNPKPPTHWYGYQPIISDSATLVLFLALLRTGATDFVTLVPYALVPPTIHLFHGRYEAAGIDFGVRLGAPLAGALVGAGLGAVVGAAAGGNDSGDFIPDWVVGAAVGGLVGFGLGIVGACALDAAALSREPIKAPAQARWMPTFVPVRGGAGMGVGGVF